MKPIGKIISVFILAFLVFNFIAFTEPKDSKNKENVIVLLKFKTQENKSQEAISEFYKLFEKVKQEPHFVSITLHQDPKDSTNILLYEEWEDESYYNNEHMNTDYLKAFMDNSRNFLAGPPDISFWKVKNVIK